MIINLELEVFEVNIILAALAAQPYSQVAEIIPKIQEQALKQQQKAKTQ